MSRQSEQKAGWRLLSHGLLCLFNSWERRWKNRKSFKDFDQAVDAAIKVDPVLNDLRKARRRINEIISEMGNKS